MIRRLNGDYVSYINNQKVILSYLHSDVGLLVINNENIGQCSYSYTKKAIQKIELKNRNRKFYIEDNDILYGDLKIGTLIDYKS